MPTLKVILLGGMQEPGHAGGSTLAGLLASPGTAPAPRTVNLAFGAGRHFCAGHAFSRAQVRIAIEALIQRFPDLALDPARPPEFRGWEFRAPRRLDVLLQARPSPA